MKDIRKKIIKWLIIVGVILLAPLAGEIFVESWDWGVGGFIFMGSMLFAAGMGYELIASTNSSLFYKAGVALSALTVFALIYVNAAVGIMGSEDNGVNLLYFGVLAVGLIGLALSRLRAEGLSRTLFATAIANALVPIIAVIFWGEAAYNTETDNPIMRSLIGANLFFITLWVVAGILFRHAAQDEKIDKQIAQPV